MRWIPACAAAALAIALIGGEPVQAQTGSGDKASIAATPAAVTASKEDAAAVARGGAVYASNCASCHGATAKGITGKGTDLVRSLYVLEDEKGILLTPPIRDGRPDKGMPKSNLTDAQILDVATWLRVQAYGAGHRTTYSFLDVLTGDAKKGEEYFNGKGKCNTCHSAAGDLKGVGGKYSAQQLQGRWLSPPAGRGGGRAQKTVAVTLANGETVSGALDRIDDFAVSLHDGAGNSRTFVRNGDVPKVIVNDPLKVHVDMLKNYSDADMHNMTAYLVTLK